jgi:hypothetical protein
VARFRSDIAEERLTVLDAADTASLLRREEHVARVAPVGDLSITTRLGAPEEIAR